MILSAACTSLMIEESDLSLSSMWWFGTVENQQQNIGESIQKRCRFLKGALPNFTHHSWMPELFPEYEYTLGCPPSQDSSGKWRFWLGSPTKNIIILVVTIASWEGLSNPKYTPLKFNILPPENQPLPWETHHFQLPCFSCTELEPAGSKQRNKTKKAGEIQPRASSQNFLKILRRPGRVVVEDSPKTSGNFAESKKIQKGGWMKTGVKPTAR